MKLCFLAWFLADAAREYTGKSYKDSGEFSFIIKTEDAGHIVEQLDNSFELDWLRPHSGRTFDVGANITFVCKPKNKNEIAKSLTTAGVDFSDQNNLDTKIKGTFDNNNMRYARSLFSLDTYHTLDQIYNWLTTMINISESATITSYGKSIEQRELYVIEIGDVINPSIIVDCGMHAREWVSFSFCLYFLNELLNGDLQTWKKDIHWVIYPVLNPDGYAYTWTNDRLWRKNTNPNLSVDGDCIGVDLNRNYDIEWMKSGSSDKPCAVTYAGTYPFSEPESKSHSIHMQTVRNPVAYLTYHAYSEFIIYPYSSSFEMEAYNKADLAAVAQKMQAAIKSTFGHEYQFGEGAVAFYPASGGSDDWAHKYAGVPIVYTIEMRDTGSYGFLLPESEIKETCIENIKGVEVVYNYVRPKITCADLNCINSECKYSASQKSMICVCPDEFVMDNNSCQLETGNNDGSDSSSKIDQNSSIALHVNLTILFVFLICL